LALWGVLRGDCVKSLFTPFENPIPRMPTTAIDQLNCPYRFIESSIRSPGYGRYFPSSNGGSNGSGCRVAQKQSRSPACFCRQLQTARGGLIQTVQQRDDGTNTGTSQCLHHRPGNILSSPRRDVQNLAGLHVIRQKTQWVQQPVGSNVK